MSALLDQRIDSKFEIVVVDDASTDSTQQILSQLAEADDRVTIRRLPSHKGPAAARNLGWRSANGEVIVFTDDDCIPEDGWLSGLLTVHSAGYEIVQGQTLPDIEDYFDRGTFSRSVEVVRFSHLYETCNVSYQRSVLEALGGFDETFGTSLGGAPNGEDADLGWRAAKSGARTAFADTATVRHPVTASSFSGSLVSRLRSFRMVYFIHRHPEAREVLPMRYFFQTSHPRAILVAAAWLPFAATRSRPLALVGFAGTAQYAKFRIGVRPLPGRRRKQPLIIAGAWLIDMTEVLVMATASVRWRCFLL
jgi:glycosyltransferase involved in cell wall biosynthesis